MSLGSTAAVVIVDGLGHGRAYEDPLTGFVRCFDCDFSLNTLHMHWDAEAVNRLFDNPSCYCTRRKPAPLKPNWYRYPP